MDGIDGWMDGMLRLGRGQGVVFINSFRVLFVRDTYILYLISHTHTHKAAKDG